MTNRLRTNLLARDAELTAFKHYVLEHRNESMNTIVNNFPFQLIDVFKYRANLMAIGYDALRYPHRVPVK